MNNSKIFVQSEGKEALGLALQLLYKNAPGGKATHYIIDNDELVLLWHEEKDCIKLPYALTVYNATDFVWEWLEQAVRKEKYGDSDYVWNKEGGFRAYCNDWGEDEKYHYGFARIVAIYVWIGK